MDKDNKLKAEKLQAKLYKLLQTKEKNQSSFEKLKRAINAVSKEIGIVKLKFYKAVQTIPNFQIGQKK